MLTPTCFCGQAIFFNGGKNVRRCPKCHAKWTRDKAGFWAENLRDIIFTPKDKFLAKRGENQFETREKTHKGSKGKNTGTKA